MSKEKKALIVGISNYGDRLPRLDSPEREIEEWRDLLMEEYGFACTDIRLLANERARRAEILSRLEWLFSDAEEGTQRVFIFAGHGVRLLPRDGNGEVLDGRDEALLAYPALPADNVDDMAIYDNELFALYAKFRPATQADMTWIFDCCHGGGFNSRDLPRRPRAMSVTAPVDLRHRLLHLDVKDMCRLDEDETEDMTMPVILNAAGELNLSVELDLDGARRSLFSYHALKELRSNRLLTYNQLLSRITDPIQQYYPQHPNLRGNRARRDNAFLN